MIFRSPQNPNSHLTIKQRRYPSFPTKQLFLKGLIKGRVLDFGSGLGVDVRFLKQKGFDVTGFDPYYQPEYPRGKFDTILCNYVLNILLPEEQSHVLMAVSELLKPEGRAYFTVRRDIRRSGFRYNPKHRCKTYQCNVVLPYKSILKTEHCEIYEYRHFNQINHTEGVNDCLFCSPTPKNDLFTESATAYTLRLQNKEGITSFAVIPKRHTEDFFKLPLKEQIACWIMLNRVKALSGSVNLRCSYSVIVERDLSAIDNINHAHILFEIK
ncbi:MAG: class I SAM-dependent methyltransferase [Methanobacteriota archaeon]|nr:MAG: class I SAM-dependent methyltransferase [Euryarchaeota archaeon]